MSVSPDALMNVMVNNENHSPPSSFIMTSMGYRITVKHLSDVIGRLLTVIFWCVSDVNASGTIDKKDFEIAIEVSDYCYDFYNDNLCNSQPMTNNIIYNNSSLEQQ